PYHSPNVAPPQKGNGPPTVGQTSPSPKNRIIPWQGKREAPTQFPSPPLAPTAPTSSRSNIPHPTGALCSTADGRGKGMGWRG
ncbi:MAG TPA: hypothetical protein VFB60_11055, partial [Ktedonobacteraceae bacterium]|nr:hypothetical protein [Ktedonobacteraceae bacterium]